jgi:hypothetical protein
MAKEEGPLVLQVCGSWCDVVKEGGAEQLAVKWEAGSTLAEVSGHMGEPVGSIVG